MSFLEKLSPFSKFFNLVKIFSSWSLEELFTGLSMVPTVCKKSGCKAQEGLSPCLYPGCPGFFQCCSCHCYVQEFKCLPWGWPMQCFSAWSAQGKLQPPPSLSRRLKWLCWHCFSHCTEPFPPTCKGFSMWPEGWADNRHVNCLHDVWVVYLLPQTNHDLFATWYQQGTKHFLHNELIFMCYISAVKE